MDDPLLVFCPYPTVHADGTLLDGISMPQTRYCKTKCEKRECVEVSPGIKEGVPALHTCSKGFSVGVVKIGDLVIRINGVVEANTSTAPNKFKKDQRDRKLKLPELEEWLRAFCAIRPEYEKHVEAKAKDAVHALHDIKSLIASVLNTAEQCILGQNGISMDEKIESTARVKYSSRCFKSQTF